MIRRTPRSTRTYTLFPYTTLFRYMGARLIGVEMAIACLEAFMSTDFLEGFEAGDGHFDRSEEHTSELQSLMRISYADFCLKKKKNKTKYSVANTTTYTKTKANVTKTHKKRDKRLHVTLTRKS